MSSSVSECRQNYQVVGGAALSLEGVAIPDCFLEGLNYLPNPTLEAENIKNLEKLQQAGQQLPIYLINAHGLVIANIFLVPPFGMSKDEVLELREYNYDHQLEKGFGISRTENHLQELQVVGEGHFDTEPNFVKLGPNTYVITTQPIAYDGECNDIKLENFLDMGSLDNFQTLRSMIFSEYAVSELFKQDGLDATFVTPGHSAINKWYSFSDKIGKVSNTRDKWGIYALDEHYKPAIGKIFHDTAHEVKDIPAQLNIIHPNTELKKDIEQSIVTNGGLFLSEIISKLGPGIYIDVGCSGILLSIHEKLKGKDGKIKRFKGTYEPEEVANDPYLYALQNAIKEDYDILTRHLNLIWTSTFSQGKLPSPQGDTNLGYTSEQQQLLNIDQFGRSTLSDAQKEFASKSTLTMQKPPDQFIRRHQRALNLKHAEGADYVFSKGEHPQHGRLDTGHALRGVHMSDPNLMEVELKKPPALQQHQLTPNELQTLHNKYGRDAVMAKLHSFGYTNADYAQDVKDGVFNETQSTVTSDNSRAVGGRKKKSRKKKRRKKKTNRKRNKQKKYKKSKKTRKKRKGKRK